MIKNYRELCSLLEIEPKKANSKNAQLKEIERYLAYRRNGHKYIITDIFSEPLHKEDNRGKNNIYGDTMQLLIMDYLIETGRTTTVITRNNLLKHINMLNENYSYCSVNVPTLSRYTSINEKIIYDFYNTSNSSFKGALETTLKNLRNKSLIMWEKVVSVFTKESIHRIANEQEKEMILKIERKILNKLGYNDIMQVRSSSKWIIFKNEMQEQLQKETKFLYYYTSYKITVNTEYIIKEYQDLLYLALNDLKRDTMKNYLNLLVIERLKENAENRNKNGFTSGKMSRYRIKETYIPDNEKLINLLIDSEADDITTEIKKMKEDILSEEELDSLFE